MALEVTREVELRAKIEDVLVRLLAAVEPVQDHFSEALNEEIVEGASLFGAALDALDDPETDENVAVQLVDACTDLLDRLLSDVAEVAARFAPPQISTQPDPLNLISVATRLVAMAEALNPPSTQARLLAVMKGLTNQGFPGGAAAVQGLYDGVVSGSRVLTDPADLSGASRAIQAVGVVLEAEGANGVIRGDVEASLGAAAPAYVLDSLRRILDQLLTAASPPTAVLSEVDLLQQSLAVLAGDTYDEISFRMGMRAAVDGAAAVLSEVAHQRGEALPAVLAKMPMDLTAGGPNLPEPESEPKTAQADPDSIVQPVVPLNAEWELVFLPDDEVLYDHPEQEKVEKRLTRLINRAPTGTAKAEPGNYLIRVRGETTPPSQEPPVGPVVIPPPPTGTEEIEVEVNGPEPTEEPSSAQMAQFANIVIEKMKRGDAADLGATEAVSNPTHDEVVAALTVYVFGQVMAGLFSDFDPEVLSLAVSDVLSGGATSAGTAAEAFTWWTDAPAGADFPGVLVHEIETVTTAAGNGVMWRLISVPNHLGHQQKTTWETAGFQILSPAAFKASVLNPSTVGPTQPAVPHPPGAVSTGLVRVEPGVVYADAVAVTLWPQGSDERREALPEEDDAEARLPAGVRPLYRILGGDLLSTLLDLRTAGQIRILGEIQSIEPPGLTPEGIKKQWTPLLSQWVDWLNNGLISTPIQMTAFPPYVRGPGARLLFQGPSGETVEVTITPSGDSVSVFLESSLGMNPDTVTETLVMGLDDALDPGNVLPWVLNQYRIYRPTDWGIELVQEAPVDRAMVLWRNQIKAEAVQQMNDLRDAALGGRLG